MPCTDLPPETLPAVEYVVLTLWYVHVVAVLPFNRRSAAAMLLIAESAPPFVDTVTDPSGRRFTFRPNDSSTCSPDFDKAFSVTDFAPGVLFSAALNDSMSC